MFHSHRKLVSNNVSFFVAALRWVHPLMQQNENKYATKKKLLFFFL